MHATYQWRNSGNPLLTFARTTWDTRAAAVFPSVTSHLGGMSVSYAGLAEGIAYTLEFTELRREGDGESAVRTTTTVRGAELRDPSRLAETDIAIVGTSAAGARRLPRTASLIVPMRVHFVIDFDRADDSRAGDGAGSGEDRGGRATSRPQISKRERAQFRSGLRRHAWTWAEERAPERFDAFYDRVYRATMLKRHGARERTESKEVSYEVLFRRGRMFFLAEDGEPVGGALCHWDRRSGTLTLRLLGVLDGSQRHLDSGAFKAIYHFLIGWCADNGVRRLDFQGTEPFLSKGTYQWKRRFGTSVILPPNHFGKKRLWLQVRRDTPEVRDYLVANPMLAENDNGCLEAVYFHDAERPARLDYAANSPGVAGIRHVDLDEFLAALPRRSERKART
ncbi:GNAT family N-acetyltransferase [Streptomyces sp. NPDC059447]|uniref:GNAT family N-acetyltransferase n=1 Tax=Streptomyces sp. NPDC059447 TaxID=3346834 RepID=UPI0036C40B0B